MVQSLRLITCTARSMGSVPGGQSSVFCMVWPKRGVRGEEHSLLYLPGLLLLCLTLLHMGFPGSSAGKESTCNAGDPSSIPGSGRPGREGIGYPLQYP